MPNQIDHLIDKKKNRFANKHAFQIYIQLGEIYLHFKHPRMQDGGNDLMPVHMLLIIHWPDVTEN